MPGTSASSSPTFLLGVGAQKAGTTWLYRHLKRSPQFAAGYRKEYHVLDVAHVPSQTYMRGRVVGMAEEATALLGAGLPADAEALHRAAMIADQSFYVDYFHGLLSRAGATLTADMTPENALVPADRLREVREGFAERGVRTMAVLLMRDPVERIWSQVRMQHHRTPDRFAEPAVETLMRVFADPQFEQRTRYDEIVRRLDQAFDEEHLTFAFYEELFTGTEVARICARLGVTGPPPRFEHRANASPREEQLTSSQTATIASHYRPVYEFVAQRFGTGVVDRLWASSHHV